MTGPRISLGAAGVFLATFLARWLVLDFDNDYFMHVAWAAEMLGGQWPIRDFVEPGFIGQTLLSYAAFRLGGYQLAGDGLIACASIAAGAGFTYAACRRLGASNPLALIVTAIALFAFPRLHAYPKALVYPAALWGIARYTGTRDRRSLATHHPSRELVLLAAIIAAAFLLRHDHGVWIAAAVTIGVILMHGTHWRPAVSGVALCAVASAALVAPFAAYVIWSGHADQYVGFLMGQGGGLISNRIAPDRTFVFDRSQPLIMLKPVEHPAVGIRWAPGASDDDRRRRERQYGLTPVSDRPGQYRLTNVSSANVTALLLDPVVEDTSGIDRRWRRVPAGLFSWTWFQLQRFVPPARLRIAPGLIEPRNALPWFTWVTFVAPFVVLALELVRRSAGSARLIVPAALLGIITYQTIVRGSPDSRLGDIAGITAVLLAWLAMQSWHVPGRAALLVRTATVLLLAMTLVSAASYGQLLTRLSAARVDGPTAVWRRASDLRERYALRPLEVFAPAGASGLPRLSRWLYECTRGSDRVSIIGFEPQVFVVAERGFAGGSVFYDLAWNSTERDQALIIERWRRQEVPVVLAMDYEWNAFSRDYPAVRTWIDERYETVQRSRFGGDKDVTVLADRMRPRHGTHAATNLPCFVPERS